ncbi:ABC transporter permease subunit [Listeria ilorinensis]|uniref:ABC transporter permease subunit n=1 Tax=Listeria ilorinensis TaxID=2867439 RepID=UPI001EF62AA7|nr:ABC transporter permease subunit [Listeria ilorinensis]
MKKGRIILGHYLAGVCGIVLISAFPALFMNGTYVSLKDFWETVQQILTGIVTPSSWVIRYVVPQPYQQIDVPLGDYLTGPFAYSITIILFSLVTALLLAFFLAIVAFSGPKWLRKGLTGVFQVLLAFPDFSFVFFIQMIVVFIYQQTGIFTMEFYSLNGEHIYLAPVICLMIVPMLLFYKLMMALLQEESVKDYVELARAKGLGERAILFHHVTPNMLRSLYFKSKTIVWFILSSYVVIEYLFGLEGIVQYMMSSFDPMTIFLTLTAMFTLFFGIYTVLDAVIGKPEQGHAEILVHFPLRPVSFKKVSLPSGKRKRGRARELVRNWRCMVPFCVLLLLVVVSLIDGVLGDPISSHKFMTDADGTIKAAAPFRPSEVPPLGTDKNGLALMDQLLVGIKYTVLLAGGIALLRVLLGYIFAVGYVFFGGKRSRRLVSGVADGMHYLPLTLILVIMLGPAFINTSGVFGATLGERIFFQALLMILIVLPITMNAVGSEIDQVLKKEYVLSSWLSGANARWILQNHVQPAIRQKVVLLYLEQFIQTLQMFVHLAVLGIFIGGAVVDEVGDFNPAIPELSGMIASAKYVFTNHQFWIILPPLVVFMLLILCVQLIVNVLTNEAVRKEGDQ